MWECWNYSASVQASLQVADFPTASSLSVLVIFLFLTDAWYQRMVSSTITAAKLRLIIALAWLTTLGNSLLISCLCFFLYLPAIFSFRKFCSFYPCFWFLQRTFSATTAQGGVRCLIWPLLKPSCAPQCATSRKNPHKGRYRSKISVFSGIFESPEKIIR